MFLIYSGKAFFALSQSVIKFSSLLMILDITEGLLWPYDKLVLPGKWWAIDISWPLIYHEYKMKMIVAKV